MKYDYTFFISYAHKDNTEDGSPGFVDEFVHKLREMHSQIFGGNNGEKDVFFDTDGIPDGSNWDLTIRSKLAKSRFLIVLLSPNYFQSKYCAKEFDWLMKHEMHRCTLGEGTMPMIINNVGVFDPKITPAPEIPECLQIQFPNWLSRIQTYQSKNFDMHDFLIAKIDDVLNNLRDKAKDKYRRQNIVDRLPYDTYPGYNENFVGRREELLSLRIHLSTRNGRRVISALTGLGGFGKTEMALTYGHAFGWDYKLGRFFKPCENCKSIYEALLTCGIQDKYGWKPEGTPEEQLQEIFERLREEQENIIAKNTEPGIPNTEGAHALIILDNVNLDNENNDEPNLISQLLALNNLPEFIHIIITTRSNTNNYSGIYTASVERLSEDESVELLSNLRPFSNLTEAQAARKIAQLLAGFTLELELTGAYLANNECITYQEQYNELKSNFEGVSQTMAVEIGELRRHSSVTLATVMKSPLSKLSPTARKALEFASLMPPDAAALGWIPELLGLDTIKGKKALSELPRYCLVTPLKSEPNIGRIHRLVAETVKQEIQKEKQREITAKIREKCNELLEKDITFWCSTEHSWNITPVFEFCLMLADNWTVEDSEEEINWNLTWMLDTAGDMLNSLGKMNETKKAYQRCFEIRKERVDAFPSCADAQRDLSVSYDSLGDLEQAAGNADAAREWYEKALEIRKQLAQKAPENVDFQRGLSISYERLGDLEKDSGNAAAAREWYEKSLEIAKQLAEKAPENVTFQQDLSTSYNKLGDLEQDAGNADAAREWYEKALEIRKQLAQKAPENVDFQRGLSISYERLGLLEQAAGNAAAAREWYEKALEISKRFAEQMKDDVQAQRNLSVSYNNLGDLEQAAGNAAAAREWYEKGLEITKQLAQKAPENVGSRRAKRS